MSIYICEIERQGIYNVNLDFTYTSFSCCFVSASTDIDRNDKDTLILKGKFKILASLSNVIRLQVTAGIGTKQV